MQIGGAVPSFVVQLVQNGVERHGGFPGLTVADDELSLAAADRDHRVDRFDAGMERRVHRFALQNRRRACLKRITLRVFSFWENIAKPILWVP